MTGRARSTGRQRAVGDGAAEHAAKQTRLTDNFPVVRGGPRAAGLDKRQPKAAVAASGAEQTATLAASEPRRTRAAAAAAATSNGTGAAPKRQRRGAKTVDTEDGESDSDVEVVEQQEEQESDDGVVAAMETSSQEGGSEEEQEAEARRRPSRRAAAGVAAAVAAVSGPGRSRTASGGAVAAAPAPSTAAHAPAGPGAVERPRRSGRAAAAPLAATCPAKARGSTKATAGCRKGPSTAAAATSKGSRTARSSGPRYFDKYEVEGEEYGRGDDVYVIETDDASLLPNGDEDEACCMCKRNTNTNRMVECDRCLRGFHMGCLRPKLTRLPEGDWLCPDCEKGIPPDSEGRELVTSSQVFLFGRRVLGLARVVGWVRNRTGDGGVEVILRHYQKPEETHVGRQKHHQSREVFLGVTECAEPAECIWGRAQVVRPDRLADTPGTDVYICEYEYDEKWKRFRRRLYGDEDGAVSDDDQEWGAAAAAGAIAGGTAARAAATGRRGGRGATAAVDSSASEADSEADEEYKPRNTLDGWVIRKARPGQQLRTSGRTTRGAGRGHAYKGIIDEHGTGLLADQGAAAVPERGPVGPLAAARRALALNCREGGLPCREGEKATLRRFIGQAVEEGGDSPGVLYICGVPGTGKTACVMEVLGGVRQQAQQNGVQLVIINALQLPSPQHVYSKLWERIAGVRWGPARALAALEEAFSGGGAVRQGAAGGGGARHMTLLLVDEIDVLITKDQAVLYNLFEWPLREGSRLAVIGISNTHDLDSRVLPRIASRLSGSKLAFNPYNFDQLKEILNHRLQGSTAFAKAAVDFCARKVASTTGDVRRALELLRRATEIAEAGLAARQQREARAAAAAADGGAGEQAQAGSEQQQQLVNVVTIKEAQAAIREMYGSAHMALLRDAGLVPKLLLVALLMELRATKKPEATVAALHHRLNSHLLLLTKDAALPLPRVVEAAAALGAQRLVAAEAGWQGPGMRLSLNVPEDDVVALLREDPSLAAVQSCLA